MAYDYRQHLSSSATGQIELCAFFIGSAAAKGGKPSRCSRCDHTWADHFGQAPYVPPKRK